MTENLKKSAVAPKAVFDMTDSALEELMFPKDKSATNKRMPNFDYIRKELLRNGVNKTDT